MKTQLNHERGSVLLTMLVLTGLVALVVGALLLVTNRQNYFTARSTTWCSEIPIAEAGVEEAMAHLNARGTGITDDGWPLVNGKYTKTRTLGDGYYFTTISQSTPPTILSVGFGRVPMQTNYTRRRVLVQTKQNIPWFGIVARGTIRMGGNSIVDSYNSTNSLYSTDGQYDPAKRTDQAGVASLSTADPAINGGRIYGFAATGPGGTVENATVGDGAWNSTTSGEQYGHVRDDFNMSIPDASLPTNATWTAIPAWSGSPSVLTNGDFKYSGNMSHGFVVSGKARVWITGTVNLTGGELIKLLPGASVEIYLAGTSFFGGNGIINPGTPADCQIYGLPTCGDIRFSGNFAVTAKVYAPEADVRLSGTPDLYGSIVCDSLRTSGTSRIHYDEALGRGIDPLYLIASWEEL